MPLVDASPMCSISTLDCLPGLHGCQYTFEFALQILSDEVATGEVAADKSWQATLAECLPYCVIRSLNISVLRRVVTGVHLRYIQLNQQQLQLKEEEDEEEEGEEEEKEEKKKKEEQELRRRLMHLCVPMLPGLLPIESSGDFVEE